MASLTLASVIVAVLLYVVPLSQSQITAIYIFDFIVVILLAADFYARMRKSKQGFRFIVRYWYEIPAMLPLFLFTVLETQPDIGGALRIFRLIRPFRLLRLLRLANLFRTIKYLKASGFIYFIIFSTVALVFGSIGIYVVEAGDPRSTIKNIGDAFWFSLTTITTTGYGDVYPVTPEGRVIAAILIFIGIGVILGFITRYGATLVEARLKTKVKLADETKTLIKSKIDGLEGLRREDVSSLVSMIISLHNNLQSGSATIHSSYCSKCGNVNPNGSAFCNNCSFKLGA